ncbi:hypothetical protein [Aquimarina sp. 2201CG5-10]|uniref:hypothetical protein n=1 Tax=Aquimarina callyspongiae TaxID=3098150 RepID=UPI002AB39D70|nr:hypothetical protein [Aquimarina sp. 2201CG5-10]MDY8138904.1 hypothetical protein [Aquimarina sp. 2201CG5-10]
MIKQLLLFIFVFITYTGYSQRDTILGPVKSVREQLLFTKAFRKKEKKRYKNVKYGPRFSRMRFYPEIFYRIPEARLPLYIDYWYGGVSVSYGSYYIEYNKQKKRTKETWYYGHNRIKADYRYTYDDNGNKTQHKEIYNDGSHRATNYHYNKKNKLLTTLLYSSDSPDFYWYKEYIYDDQENLIEIKKSGPRGATGNSTIYEYDDQNRRIKIFSHSSYTTKYPEWVEKQPQHIRIQLHLDGKMKELGRRVPKETTTLKTSYVWDDQNRKIEIQEHDEYKLNIKLKYKGDLLIQIKRTNKDSLVTFTDKEYNDDKRIIKSARTNVKYPKDSTSKRYFYNQKERLSKIINNGKYKIDTVAFKYTYDQYNNWIEQTKSVNGEELYVRKRKITYYTD